MAVQNAAFWGPLCLTHRGSNRGVAVKLVGTRVGWDRCGQWIQQRVVMWVSSRFSRVQLFVPPWAAACQTPLPMRFPRQEYWSGLPCSPPGDLPSPGVKPRSPALQVESLLSDPPGKPMNTGMGNLSLLQGILPIQGLNRDLWHCRWILYQLSYQGSLSAGKAGDYDRISLL